MKRIPYLTRRGKFNGVHADIDATDAAHMSRFSSAGLVVRIGQPDAYRYFLGGYEVAHKDVFLQPGEKPAVIKPTRKRVRCCRDRDPIFVWGGYQPTYGPFLDIRWTTQYTTIDRVCKNTGEVIRKGDLCFAPCSGSAWVMKWRLAHIPDDATIIDEALAGEAEALINGDRIGAIMAAEGCTYEEAMELDYYNKKGRAVCHG